MNIFKKLTIPALLLASAAVSPLAMAHGSFDGHDVNVKFELWDLDEDNNIDSVLAVRNEELVTASDDDTPDVENFYALNENHHLWDIDFEGREVELIYNSIAVEGFDNQYMYMSIVGFGIEDADDSLSDILHVSVDDSFAPSFYNKDLLRYDANKIYLSLQGSMCHKDGMPSMPACDNEDSPTGYSNILKLNILFADNADDLYAWGEETYPELFPEHQESFYLIGYYVREYKDYYLGTKGGELYLYTKATGDMLELGDIEPFMEMMHMDHMNDHDHEASTECPEGQHMMADGMCMDNSAMSM